MSVSSVVLRGLGGGFLRCNVVTPGIRSPACFRSFAAQTLNPQIQTQKQKLRQAPCLLLSSPTRPETRYLVDAQDQGIIREFHLPSIAGHNFVGSSQGFLLSVDPHAADLHATNPFTGAQIQLPPTASLPGVLGVFRDPTSGRIVEYLCSLGWREGHPLEFKTQTFEGSKKDETFTISWPKEGDGGADPQALDMSFMRYYCRRAILSPALDAAVVLHGARFGLLAFARVGPTSSPPSSWMALESPVNYLQDVIFRRGRLHAVNREGTLAVFDLDDPSTHDFTDLIPNSIYFTDEYDTGYSGTPPIYADTGIHFLDNGRCQYHYLKHRTSDGEMQKLNWPPPIWFVPSM